MNRHKSEKRWAGFAQTNSVLLDEVRQEIRERGPLRSRDIEGKAVNHYRSSKDTGVALYYLWLTGELMIHSRQGRERIYDFLENVAPVHLQCSATETEAVHLFIRKAVSHLGVVSERDFRRILKSVKARPVDAKETTSTLAEMVETGLLKNVRLENHKDPLYYLASDAALVNKLSNGSVPSDDWHPIRTTTTEEVLFLSPLESVSARGRAKALFGVDYIWEIYKPASKREYGPYTMPILYGDRLVARIDAKLERQRQTLRINGFWLEKWFVPDDTFAQALATGLLTLSTFLGVRRLGTTPLRPHFLRAQANEYLLAHEVMSV